jgi:hypothetical protein
MLCTVFLHQEGATYFAEFTLIIILFRMLFATFSADIGNWQFYLDSVLLHDH